MMRAGLIVLTTAILANGCATPPKASPVYWHEGENFANPDINADEVTAEKAPASGGRSLTGNALQKAGDSVSYQCQVAKAMVDARLWIRYSRNQWDNSPSKLDITLTQGETRLAAAAELPSTGGWGSTAKADWKMVAVDLGSIAAGDCTLTLTAAKAEHNDLNIDGFFLAPADIDIDADHLGSADRLHVDQNGYVGLSVGSVAIRQNQPTEIALIGRGFVPRSRRATVRIEFVKGPPSAILFKGSVGLSNEPVTIALPTEKMREFRDGPFYLSADWASGPRMFIDVDLIGKLATQFDQRLDRIQTTQTALIARDDSLSEALALDYEHAIDYLQSGWKQILEGTVPPNLIDHVHWALWQYETTGRTIAAGKNPYETSERIRDRRFAFRSATTGKLEPFRLILPDSYRPDGDTPVILALNGTEDRFLDRAEAVKRIANERGYAIISPRASSGYLGKGRRDLFQVIDVAQERFSGLSRERVYCTGPSAGGFATYALATVQPHRFAAIACANGAGNWRRFARPDRTLIERFSPVPTLIIHGRKDPVVAATDIEQFAARLKEQNLPYEMRIFPTHGHSYMSNAELYLNLTLDYFDRHTERIAPPEPKPEPTPQPAATQPQSP